MKIGMDMFNHLNFWFLQKKISGNVHVGCFWCWRQQKWWFWGIFTSCFAWLTKKVLKFFFDMNDIETCLWGPKWSRKPITINFFRIPWVQWHPLSSPFFKYWPCIEKYIEKNPISVDGNFEKIWSLNSFSFIFSGKLLDKIILKVTKNRSQKNNISMWKLKSTNGGANLPPPGIGLRRKKLLKQGHFCQKCAKISTDLENKASKDFEITCFLLCVNLHHC